MEMFSYNSGCQLWSEPGAALQLPPYLPVLQQKPGQMQAPGACPANSQFAFTGGDAFSARHAVAELARNR